MSGHQENPPVTWTEYTRLYGTLQKQLHDRDNGVRDELGSVRTGLNNLGEEVTQLRTDINNNFLELHAMFNQPNVHRKDFHDKPKFSIPIFSGRTDVQEYLTWELEIDTLFRMHNYTNERKLLLASSGLADYATHWWEQFIRKRMERHELPIITWEQMKQHFWARFVPRHYKRSLLDKLTCPRKGLNAASISHVKATEHGTFPSVHVSCSAASLLHEEFVVTGNCSIADPQSLGDGMYPNPYENECHIAKLSENDKESELCDSTICEVESISIECEKMHQQKIEK